MYQRVRPSDTCATEGTESPRTKARGRGRSEREFFAFRRRAMFGAGVILLGLAIVGAPTAARQNGLTIQLSSATLPVGASLDLGAMDLSGQPVSGVEWSSSDPAVVTVNGTGIVSAVGGGQAVVLAETGSLDARVAIGVGTAPGDLPGGGDTDDPPDEEPPPSGGGDPVPPSGDSNYIWISPSELAARPTSGPAWEHLLDAASGSCGTPALSDQNDPTNVCVLAKALVFARTGNLQAQLGVVDAIWAIVNAGQYSGRALALGRELAAYVIAADLIDLGTYDAGLDSRFRKTIAELRTTSTDSGPGSLIECHELRPNNWGTNCGASRVAVAAYLGDSTDLARAAQVFKGYLGDRASFAGFKYGDLTWQCDAANPVGINPKGCTRDGHSIDGVMPDDQRRGGDFTWPPPPENYAYGGLSGALAQAVILHRAGYDVFNWEDQALFRAFNWLHTQANFPAEGDDTWQPHLVNHFYNTSFPAPIPARAGKNMAWTDWTHGR